MFRIFKQGNQLRTILRIEIEEPFFPWIHGRDGRTEKQSAPVNFTGQVSHNEI